jgi:uncharacterized cysteine cluster protein YcgN (CxxCxxCC family)
MPRAPRKSTETRSRFWEEKSLREMSPEEWEALCDGCARCCLHKLEDSDTGEVHYTDVSCRLLDTHSCRCTRYRERLKLVPDCVKLRPDNLDSFVWMPDTCAYRLLYEGKPLEPWHPLVSNDPESVHTAGISVRGKVVSERFVDADDLIGHVLDRRAGKADPT